MIMPARWYAGGRGLDDFRADMLSDKTIRSLHDLSESIRPFSVMWDQRWIMLFPNGRKI